MPTVPQTTLQAGGRPGNPFADVTASDVASAGATAGKFVLENVAPGSSDYAAVRNSIQIGSQIGPALREGRYGDAVRAFLDSTTAAIGALPMVPSLAGVIRAFHGTPHAFEKFDLSKIGTGEGAQAYGHGLYFAENRNIAEHYQTALSGRGTPHEEYMANVASKFGDDPALKPLADMAWQTFLGKGPLGAKQAMDDMAKAFPEGHKFRDFARWAGEEFDKPRGHLYTVDLNVNHEDLLDWDKPLQQQPPKVKAALESLGVDTKPEILTFDSGFQMEHPGPTGEILYKRFGSPAEASAKLREAGIPGIRYADAGSRGAAGSQTSNIVVFDDKLVTIKDRNGVPVTDPAERQAALDMSQQARLQRAKKQGFTIDAYHGGPGSNPYDTAGKMGTISEFKLGPEGAAFFTDDPKLASEYARQRYPERGAVYPVKLDASSMVTVDASERSYTNKELLDLAKEKGASVVELKNVHDNPQGYSGGASTIYLVTDPSKVRSTQAAFDPAKRGSGNILAGTASVVAAGGAAGYALYGGQAEAAPKPAAERAADGLAQLAAPEAWLRQGPGGTRYGGT